jgi:Fe-S cluster biogenesis protein NfuA
MFIQTESTPNPDALKFIPGQQLLPAGEDVTCLSSDEAAKKSPLAARLFSVDGVKEVYIGHDFITVTKVPSVEWYLIKAELLTSIMEQLLAGRPIVSADDAKAEQGELDGLSAQIKELIETRVRPAVAQDGGDIQFHSFEHGVVKVHLRGACSGCPSSSITLKSGIENMLKYYVPEVEAVEAV